MKLRNKKTGEIMDDAQYRNFSLSDGFGFRLGDKEYYYHSLAELNDEWEDYEEPKDNNYWYIDSLGKIEFHSTILDEIAGTPNNAMIRKIIGNYFESREEAEQAVEKLKAWKRLKDSGISFEAKVIDGRWYLGPKVESQPRTSDEVHNLFKDIMFIFGGEDESNQ